MAYKKYLILFILSIVLIFVVVELFAIKKITIKNTPKKTTTSSPVSQNLPPGAQSMFDLPDGYFITSSIQLAQSLPQSYILLAKLISVGIQKDNTILAHISFATSQGTGKTINQAILISPVLILTKQNTLRMFPVSKNMRSTTLKNSQETLSTLQKLQGRSILFTFLNQLPNPNLKVPQKDVNPQCNNALLLTLSVNYDMPKCLPFTQKITIYENF